MHRRKDRPNLLDDEFLLNVKDMVTGVHMAGWVIFRKIGIAIGTGVIKANCPSKLKDFRGHIAGADPGLILGCFKIKKKQQNVTIRCIKSKRDFTIYYFD